MRCLVFLVLLLAACSSDVPEQVSVPEPVDVPSVEPVQFPVFGKGLVIETWNIYELNQNVNDSSALRVFGELARADVLAVQRIDGGVSGVLLEKLRDGGRNVEVVLSDRLGYLQEQYGFFYDADKVELLDTWQYDDSNHWFDMPPFFAHFKARQGVFDFWVVNLYVPPVNVGPVLGFLVEGVIDDFADGLSDDKDIIILGDLSADCDYFNASDSSHPLLHPGLFWVVKDVGHIKADTTFDDSVCAFDRVIFAKDFTFEDYAGEYRVLDSKLIYGGLAEKVSGHYPVVVVFNIDMDTG